MIYNLISFFENTASKNYHTISYGIARSILALGTLLTLAFNKSETLFIQQVFESKTAHFSHISLFHLFGYENIFFAKVIGMLILVVVILGILPAITGILHWWVSFSFCQSSIFMDGGDQITAVLTLLLIPITLFDPRISHWKVNTKKINSYFNFITLCFFVLIQIQIAILYLNAGVSKLSVEEWADGTALYYWLNNNIFGAPEYLKTFSNYITHNPFTISMLTWGTILFEIVMFGIFFSTRKVKKIFFIFGIIFHLLILIFLGLASFFFAMAGALVLYLVPFENVNLKSNLIKFKRKYEYTS